MPFPRSSERRPFPDRQVNTFRRGTAAEGFNMSIAIQIAGNESIFHGKWPTKID